jgi:hypothetical protein
MGTVVIPVQTQEMKQSRAWQLIRLIYLQAIFLSLAYAAGVWVTFTVSGASISTSQVIGHGILASSFGVATALVALMAAIQGMRRVSIYNIVLLAFALVAGTSGFAFLGNHSSFSAYETTNTLMTSVVAVGMPITGVSLALVSKTVRRSPAADAGIRMPLFVTYATLGALALTIIAGVGVTSTPIPTIMTTAHFAFAGLTVALVLALVVITARGAFGRQSLSYLRSRVPFSLISLLFVAVAVVLGIMFRYFGGGITYVIGMADLTLLVYAFLLFGIQRPWERA